MMVTKPRTGVAVIRSQFRPLIEHAALTRQLDPDLLEAQVLVESSDDPWAFRFEPAFYDRYLKGKPAGAVWGRLGACSYGLLQIMGVVAQELGFSGPPTELFVPAHNLTWGALKLARLRDQCSGDIHAALAAYNGGLVGNVLPPYRNAIYLQKVLRTRARFEVLHA